MKNKSEEAAALSKLQAKLEAAEEAAASATADKHNAMLFCKCLTEYKTAMDNALYSKAGRYYEANDLQLIHYEARENSLEVVI